MASHNRWLYKVIIDPWNRLILSTSLGAFAYWLLPLPASYWDIRLITAYIFSVSVNLAIIMTMMFSLTAEATSRQARGQEPSNTAVLTLILLFSAVTLATLALMLDNSQHRPVLIANLHMGLSLLAIFLSWLFVHTYFALHYARIYYQQNSESDSLLVERIVQADGGGADYVGGLDFPNSGLVDYWDFLYYSFTIAMCYQTSDISVTSAAMRRVTLVHAIVSFIYVSSIIGLVVNLVSNVV
jgi:uncharacterized membrane protein